MIKYRVFYKPENKYLDRGSDQLFINREGKVFWYSHEGFDDITDKVIIEQYTGLSDRVGTDIYEGDIIIKVTDGYNYNDHIFNGVVVWKNDRYMLQNVCEYKYPKERRKAPSPQNQNGWKKYMEVIGNIHQNPELLEAK